MEIPRGATKCPHCQSDLRSWFLRHYIVTILGAIFFVGTIISVASDNADRSGRGENKQELAQSQVSYETVTQWDIPNGGKGKIIVIPENYLNETGMLALGETLKSEAVNDRNASITVFSDRKAADLRDKVISEKATSSEEEFYLDHLVASYSKNANTGFHVFEIWFDGINGSDSKKIEY